MLTFGRLNLHTYIFTGSAKSSNSPSFLENAREFFKMGIQMFNEFEETSFSDKTFGPVGLGGPIGR